MAGSDRHGRSDLTGLGDLSGLEEQRRDIYDRLFEAFGPQHWWPGDGAFEIIIGAILTQSTNWGNVARAIANLKQAGVLNPQGLAGLDDEHLAGLIRPSGYYHAKARKVRAFLDLLMAEYSGNLSALLALDLPDLRRVLLATHGIGPETADAIILYAAGTPIFVVDAYTRRIFARLDLCPPAGRYDDLQALFMTNLPHDATLFNEYHALLVHLGKHICTKRTPRCRECPLRSVGCLMTGC